MIVNEQKLGGYSQSNSPFVLSLYLIDKSDVISVMDPFRHKLPGAHLSRIPFGGIVLKTGTMITQMKFPPLSCNFSQSFTRSDGGVTSSFGINFSIPASREDVTDWYNEAMERQFVCLMEDANRQGYIIGNEERGLRAAMAQSISSVNEHAISLTAVLNLPAFILPSLTGGIVLADLFPDTDFSYDFSLDFNA